MKPRSSDRSSSEVVLEPKTPGTEGLGGRNLWWNDLVAQIYRECAIRNTNAEVAVSVPRAFLASQKIAISGKVEPEIIDNLRQATTEPGGLSKAGFKLPSAGADDAAYVSRIRRVVLAHDALRAESFGAGFQELLTATNPPLTITQLAEASGLSVPKIRNALKSENGCTGLEEPEVCRLDDVLGSKGKLVALYAALSQHAGFKDALPAMNEALSTDTFGMILRCARLALELTLTDVSEALMKAGFLVSESQLSGWEGGYNKPRKKMSKAVLMLDELLRCDGTLVIAWDEQNRGGALPPYALRFSEWPPKLKKQFLLLAEFKEREYSDSPGPQDPGRWGVAASKERSLESLERIFGFLTKFHSFPTESLSLTLLADFTLVVAFFEFVRKRVGRDDYSYDAIMISSVLKNWYTYFFPALLPDVCGEAYWAKHLREVAEGVKEVVPGVLRPYQRELKTVETRWGYQLFMAIRQCQAFRKSGKFSRSHLGKSAELLFRHPGALGQMAKILVEQIRAVSGRVSCVEMALHMRRLTLAVTLIARCFRPQTLLSLQTKHALPQLDGRVWLEVPPELYKQKGEGGSQAGFQGYLSDYPYMHEIFRRYIQEARPFLLGDAQARHHRDDGYIFTPACNERRKSGAEGLVPGGPLSHELLRHDIYMVLGYAPYAQRHIFSTEALLLDLITQEVAEVLANTSRMIDLHYEQGSPEFNMEIANQGIEMLLFEK